MTHTPPLEDRIRRIRADIESIVNARAAAVAKENPGVPVGVIRNLLTARAPGLPLRTISRDRRSGRELRVGYQGRGCAPVRF